MRLEKVFKILYSLGIENISFRPYDLGDWVLNFRLKETEISLNLYRKDPEILLISCDGGNPHQRISCLKSLRQDLLANC